MNLFIKGTKNTIRKNTNGQDLRMAAAQERKKLLTVLFEK